MNHSEKGIYRLLTYAFLIVLSCHVLLALFIIVNPDKEYLTHQRWEKAYRLFALTGPFFSEDRINVVPHVHYSLKEKNKSWNAVEELGKSSFLEYHKNYFNHSQFLLSGLPKYLCRQFQLHKNERDSVVQLQALKRFIQLTNAETEIDSVRVIYTLESLTEPTIDTLFVLDMGQFE